MLKMKGTILLPTVQLTEISLLDRILINLYGILELLFLHTYWSRLGKSSAAQLKSRASAPVTQPESQK